MERSLRLDMIDFTFQYLLRRILFSFYVRRYHSEKIRLNNINEIVKASQVKIIGIFE